jgi:hypothetical protein
MNQWKLFGPEMTRNARTVVAVRRAMIIQHFRPGITVRGLAETLSANRETIRRDMHHLGLPVSRNNRRRPKWETPRNLELIRIIQEEPHRTRQDIARQFGISAARVGQILKLANLQRS